MHGCIGVSYALCILIHVCISVCVWVCVNHAFILLTGLLLFQVREHDNSRVLGCCFLGPLKPQIWLYIFFPSTSSIEFASDPYPVPYLHTNTHTHKAASRCCGLPHFQQPALYIFICHSVYIHPFLESAAYRDAPLRFSYDPYGMYSTSRMYVCIMCNKTLRKCLPWASNDSPDICCFNLALKQYDVEESEKMKKLNLKLSLHLSHKGSLSIARFPSDLLWVKRWTHGSYHVRQRLNRECHNDTEFDNGTIEALSIIELSLEKSAKTEIPTLFLSTVFFIHFNI